MCNQFDFLFNAWLDSDTGQSGETFEAMMEHPVNCDVCWRELLHQQPPLGTVTDWVDEAQPPAVNRAAMRRPSKWRPSPLREAVSARHVTVGGVGVVGRVSKKR